LSKITIFKLDFDTQEEFEFNLIAINSPLKDYRLCHFVNKYGNLKLTRDNTEHILQNPHKDNSDFYFSKYSHVTKDYEIEQYLLSNKGLEGGFIIPEQPSFDYFLILKSFIDQEDLKALVENINKIPEVFFAKEISPNVLKSKENLIF